MKAFHSCFHDSFREYPASISSEGNMRAGFFGAYGEEQCEPLKLARPEIDRRLKERPALVSANFVIPYPPGFSIMVSAQVITAETIGFMRQLNVKEIHGFSASLGLKLLKASVLEAAKPQAPSTTLEEKRAKRKSAA